MIHLDDTNANVIGVCEEYENMQEIDTVNGRRHIVRFRMTDGRYSSVVAIWGDLAKAAQKEKDKAIETPVIAIMTCTKLKTFRNTVQINTVPSSRIYMNLDIDAVIAMRQRLIDEGYTPGEGNTATPANRTVHQIVETMSLNELSEKITEDYIKKNIFCVVKIVSVEETGWWCNSCGGCGSEVEKQDGKLFCTSCEHCIPVAEKRYRVVVLGEDSTEAYNFVLMDRAVKRKVGISATKMISDKLKNQTSTDFPEQIRTISSKELRLKLLINEDNVKVNSRLFFAVDAIDASAPISAICSVSGTYSTTSSIANSAAVKLSEENDTPSTSKSSSKRVKTEP
ncbi:uncharacterized protein LOC108221270 [Daucus carota subsp. sativus]|uniref:uncharacterized protein LOC108221270 n=1 Tax=Daucus carota subsp. sativus TaxID=79200 RepID=UPI0007EF4843|nr:PREDICTED: uncharacterized protein LOC108221270 [Daucus carota subsp. sativus]